VLSEMGLKLVEGGGAVWGAVSGPVAWNAGRPLRATESPDDPEISRRVACANGPVKTLMFVENVQFPTRTPL
jgi:hypothetical protein